MPTAPSRDHEGKAQGPALEKVAGKDASKAWAGMIPESLIPFQDHPASRFLGSQFSIAASKA